MGDAVAGFPEDLAEDAEAEFGVGGGEAEAADEAANFFVGGGGGAALGGAGGSRFQIAAGTKGVEQHGGDAFEFGGGGAAGTKSRSLTAPACGRQARDDKRRIGMTG